MKKTVALLTSIFFISSATGAALDYSTLDSADSQRVGEMVIRYMTSLDSPCLYIEILDPRSPWKVVQQKEICTIHHKNLNTDFSYAGFSKIKFNSDSIQALLTLIPLRAIFEDNLKCSIALTDHSIGDLQCEAGREDQY